VERKAGTMDIVRKEREGKKGRQKPAEKASD
jgi:hypothetical protein